jgi:hypothetical protein
MLIKDEARCPTTVQAATANAVNQGPDKTSSDQEKCKPDPVTGNCPKGFFMNGGGHCVPEGACPKGFERGFQFVKVKHSFSLNNY